MSTKAERLLDQALALAPEERRAFTAEACRGDVKLEDELISLLRDAEGADEFFDRLDHAVFSSPFSMAGDVPCPRPPDPDLEVGEVIGRYRILSVAGSGGMGTVYRARDTQLDRDVALKFLPADLRAKGSSGERLASEARAAAALDHPYICTIHEIGQTDDGRGFIAMACYEGETLKERLARGQLPLEECVTTALQIARALAAAHTRGIIHRDVKPGNVMLVPDGTVRLLDFGLAMAVDATRLSSGMTPGTIAYMSPEQVRGDALDARTDLWSLGVVLYEMLTGLRPFRGEDRDALLHAILHDMPEPIAKRRAGAPASLTRIAEKLLRQEPSARYSNANDVVADLARELPWRAGSHRPSPLTKRAILVAGGAVLLLTLAGTAVRTQWSGDSPSAAAVTGGTVPSIAVMPLATLGADSADAALAHGMTEELISALSRTGNVRVIASPSVSPFRNRRMDVRDIAESLGVSNVVEGGLQRTGSRLRVQVRLVSARDGSTRWAETYDREFKDVFAVQDEIARAVAGELGLRFDRDRQLLRRNPRNITAYELYLRASDPVLLRGQAGIWKAQELFQQAIAADSTYAAAHSGLALAYVHRARHASDPGMPVTRLLALADREARTAVALDATLPEAHYALGRVREAMLDFASAESAIRRAIALDPTRSTYRKALSHLHAWAGRPEDELAEARRALETDPLNPYAHAAVASALYGNRRYDEALSRFQRVATFQPPLLLVSFGLAQCYAKKEMWPEAIAALRPQAEAGDPLFVALLGHMLARTGQLGEAKRILTELMARRERAGTGAFHIAVVYAGLGDPDQTFAWLDRAVDDRSIESVIMGPTFEDLHRDPRFKQLRKRLGFGT